MMRKFNHRFLCSLFHLLAYLSDRTNGAALFVRPKMVIGTFIISLGVTSIDAQKTIRPVQSSKQWSVKKGSAIYIVDGDAVLCYESVDEPYIIVEQMPEFPGGQDTMRIFIDKHFIYPQKAIKDGKSGMVICAFVVNQDGSISNIEVVRGIHPLLDAEAVRVIKSFPKWKPGKQKGKAVPVKYTLPIRFTLPNKK